MATWNQLVAVAEDCSGYNPIQRGMVSSALVSRSCGNCLHFKHQRCELDLFDKILDSQESK